ncbi:YceI family protein [Maricaulis sp.]|uniref:YceI family protein n=1 Tax=Maricaulis sp. TaxID=1486257 RepID=UPI00262AE230|nr:YceI family protein [Maricaulis sp.]
MRLHALALALPLFIAACATPTTDPARLPAGQWELDQGHASVVWRVRHLGLSWYTGRFDSLRASLDFDAERPDEAQLTAIIDTASISTGDSDFDRTLAQDWFNAERHPEIRFTSNRIEITGETTGRAYGTLRLNGRTEETVMEIEFYGGLFNLLEGRNTIGFGADMVIDRSAFGIGNLPETVLGREIRIRIEAEFLEGGE